MRKTTQNWIDGSDYDYKTAESLLKAKRFVYVIFMCHLAIEKLLKAIYSEKLGKIPPRTHSLIRLLDLCEILLSKTTFDFIEEISDKSVPTRYPEDLTVINRQLTIKSTKRILNKTKGVLEWLKKNSILEK